MSLNRKAMVLAVGAALAAPCAHAQIKSPAGTDWEFYGKFYPELAHTSSSGATAPGTTGLFTFVNALGATPIAPGNPNAIVSKWEMLISNTYLGFRGSKDIGRGGKAIWQLEQTVQIDEGNTAASFANRDSFAGLAYDSWGTIRLGIMDTPFKKGGNVLGFLGVNSGNFVSGPNVLQKGNFGASSSSSFNLRRANAFDFTSPTILGGLQTQVQYSLGNPTEAATTVTPARNPRVASWSIKWEQGPLLAAFSQETHFDLFGGSLNVPAAQSNSTDSAVHSKDTANQVAVVGKLGNHSLEADVASKKYSESSVTATAGGKFVEYKTVAYQFIWEARWSGTWRTAVNYGKGGAGSCKQAILSNASCSTNGLEGNQISLGAAYYLDPSVYLFLLVNKMTNGASGQYNSSANQKPNPGEDIKSGAIGIAYTF